ncbi:hypothetical protein [Streptomyces sp. NPDC059168]|uniref:hypothetical protein n=1 Tax=Streptomyces sp. NPDC059168 TaxID=3346753 RepID=UPI0036B998FC
MCYLPVDSWESVPAAGSSAEAAASDPALPVEVLAPGPVCVAPAPAAASAAAAAAFGTYGWASAGAPGPGVTSVGG